MKLRLLPIVITAVVSSLVFFGGWFVYHSMAMEDPLIRAVTDLEGVQDVKVQIDREQAKIDVQLASGFHLQHTYESVQSIAKEILGNRSVTVNISGNSSDALDKWWANALFDVAQAMETKQYAMIPQRLGELAGESVIVHTEMDENNVYVTLKQGADSKYIVLPRIPMKMGVWPNEQIR